MLGKYRFGIISLFLLVMLAGFVLFGTPYGRFTWENSVSAAPYSQTQNFCFVPTDANGKLPPLITITCSQATLYGEPGGATVVNDDGSAMVVTAGARWFPVNKPVADKSGRLWQQIWVGGGCPYVPLTCVR